MTESIGIHYNIIDDSSGCVWPFFGKCVEKMGACLPSMNRSDEERQHHAYYLSRWLLRVFPDFMEYHHEILVQLCKGRRDLEIWKDVLESERHRTTRDGIGSRHVIHEYYFNKAY